MVEFFYVFLSETRCMCIHFCMYFRYLPYKDELFSYLLNVTHTQHHFCRSSKISVKWRSSWSAARRYGR